MYEEETYVCKECGATMELIENEELVCMECGYSVDLEDYGIEDDTHYDTYYQIEAYTQNCNSFPEDFPPINYEEDEEEE